MLVLLIIFNFIFASEQNLEEKKVLCLINKIRQSQIEFIRNGTVHKSEEAADHILMKYSKAKNSGWPFYKKRKVNAKLFIEKVASKSSFSGRPYKIKVQEIPTNVLPWLYHLLRTSCRTDQLL